MTCRYLSALVGGWPVVFPVDVEVPVPHGRFEALPLSECTSRLGDFILDEGRAYCFDDDTVRCLDVPSWS